MHGMHPLAIGPLQVMQSEVLLLVSVMCLQSALVAPLRQTVPSRAAQAVCLGLPAKEPAAAGSAAPHRLPVLLLVGMSVAAAHKSVSDLMVLCLHSIRPRVPPPRQSPATMQHAMLSIGSPNEMRLVGTPNAGRTATGTCAHGKHATTEGPVKLQTLQTIWSMHRMAHRGVH